MKRITWIVAAGLVVSVALAGFTGCDSANPYGNVTVRLVPDDTPIIVSTLEYSPDTTFHHAQVYVGTVTDPLDRSYDLFQDAEHRPGFEMWHPSFWAQVGMKLYRLHLRPTPDDGASVSITGPLNGGSAQTIRFAFETRGVYGDTA